MKEFRSLEDVEQAGLPDNLFRVVHSSLQGLIECYAGSGFEYTPEDDGFAVLIEAGDSEESISSAIGHSLIDAPWEGASLTDGYFIAVLMHNNQYGITVFLEDGPPLDPAVRARLMDDM